MPESSLTHPRHDLIALGVQQPWAELILRGVKTIEVRSLTTQIRGPIYLYASKRTSTMPAAAEMIARQQLDLEPLPKGVLVGTVDILESRPCTPRDASAACVPPDLLVGKQAWVLSQPRRLPHLLEVRFLPYGVWFYPFQRKYRSA